MALVAGDDASDLDVVVQEGHEFGPGEAPHAGDRGVSLSPLVVELLESGQGCGFVGGGVNRP